MRPLRVLFCGNPSARSGKAAERMARAVAAMRARGWRVTERPTQPDGATVAAVAEALDGEAFDRVVFLGGDGTFNEVARGILAAGSPVPLGMLPSGTANDQGKSFGVSSREADLDRNLDVIAAGALCALDGGVIDRIGPDGAPTHTTWFFDSCGFGLQPDVLLTRNRDREIVKKIPLLRELYRDQLVYAGAGAKEYLRTWLEPTRFAAEIVTPERAVRYERLTDLIIKNTAVYAGEWVLDRQGRPDDGRFELVPFEGRRDLFSKLVRDSRHIPIWQEHLDLLGVTHSRGFSASRFEISLLRPDRPEVQSQVDGDEWVAGDTFRVSVRAGVLPLVVPADWVPPWRPGRVEAEGGAGPGEAGAR